MNIKFRSETDDIHHILCFFAVIIFCLIPFGCDSGGGGNGGDGGDGAPGLTYSGVNTPAVITENNAGVLAVNALEFGSSGAAFSSIFSAGNTDRIMDEPPVRSFLVDAIFLVEEAIERVDFGVLADRKIPAAVEAGSDVLYGPCGGSAPYTIQVDTDTGIFSMSISFNDYCDDGLFLNGEADVWGVINNFNPIEFGSITIRFDSITGSDGSASITMDGEVAYIKSGATTSMSMDMLIRDDTTGNVYMLENYQLETTDYYAYTENEVSGRFYYPEYGYVDMTTMEPLVVFNGDDFPSSGQIMLTGEVGSSEGPTRARLTALSSTQCLVEADTNGDGSYDYNSGSVYWTAL